MQQISFQPSRGMASSVRFGSWSNPRRGGDDGGNNDGGTRNVQIAKKAGVGVAALLAVLGVGKAVDYTIFESTPPKGTSCVNFSKSNGVDPDIKKNEEGRQTQIPFIDDWTCFIRNDIRVTEKVPVRTHGVDVVIPTSIAWKPNEGKLDTVFSEVYGTGPTGDPDLASSMAQIGEKGNQGIYENALYSEIRSFVAQYTKLVPPNQIDSQAFVDGLHNAILNGYDPKKEYEKFKDAALNTDKPSTEPTGDEGLPPMILSGPQKSLQERLTERYGDNLVLITDADARDMEIVDPQYKQALQQLAQLAVDLQKAEQQKAVNEAAGRANLATAEADKLVKEKNAEADAEVIRKIGRALREFPESIQQTYAEGFKIAAEKGQLIITDGKGNNPMIIQPNQGK